MSNPYTDGYGAAIRAAACALDRFARIRPEAAAALAEARDHVAGLYARDWHNPYTCEDPSHDYCAEVVREFRAAADASNVYGVTR